MPCFKRYKDLESIKFKEQLIDENDDEGGWVDAHLNEQKDNEEIYLGVEVTEDSLLNEQNLDENNANDDSEAEDIENYMERQNINDENDTVS